MFMTKNEQGTALFGAVLVTVILTMVGTVSVNLASHEVDQVRVARDEVAAQNLAEAGVDLVVQWFHDPGSVPTKMEKNVIEKQFNYPDSGPSFFNGSGQSQFSGTEASPDIMYDASRPDDDKLLNDPSSGWFRSLRSLGRILKIKVYGPTRPGLLSTVEVTAGVKGLTRTVAIQLGTLNVPPIRAAVQIGNQHVTPDKDAPLPLWMHWGDVKIEGDIYFSEQTDVPLKTSMAAITGHSYSHSSTAEDRWVDVFLGGEALFPSTPSDFRPLNLHSRQDPHPGLYRDHWDYGTMKKYALKFGTYYARGQDGLLYRSGTIQPGLGLAANEVFRSTGVGDHRGIVFIDTLDQLPPNSENLGILSIETDYAEGIFVINANVELKPAGSGKSVHALSPPTEESLGPRIPVELSNVHIQGVLYSAGDISFEGQPRLYGAMVVEGRIRASSKDFTPLEIWYNHDLSKGLFRGIPLVYVAPGTWQSKY